MPEAGTGPGSATVFLSSSQHKREREANGLIFEATSKHHAAIKQITRLLSPKSRIVTKAEGRMKKRGGAC